MNCETFINDRSRGAGHDAQSLQHLRSCQSCLEAAAALNPDDLFRSLGGDDLLPPGGMDLFVAEVLREVEVRETEHQLSPARRVAPAWRWAAAAAIAAGIFIASLNRFDTPASSFGHPPVAGLHLPPSAPVTATLSPAARPEQSRPVVESYDNSSATIVEVPSDKNDVAVVMIFDQNLPADL